MKTTRDRINEIQLDYSPGSPLSEHLNLINTPVPHYAKLNEEWEFVMKEGELRIEIVNQWGIDSMWLTGFIALNYDEDWDKVLERIIKQSLLQQVKND